MMKLSVSMILLPIAACVALLQSPAFAAAADKPALTSELQVWNVVKGADGAETLQPARSVKPGDVLQYTAVYKNADSRAVNRLVASLPIPAGTELVGASAMPREVQASLDGKVYAATPLMRKVRRADGQMADVPVPLTEYRYLRWPEQQVAAGASFSTSARVRVVASLASVPTSTSTPAPATAAAVTPTPATAPAAR
jgi:hypothetical protein